MVMNKFNLRLVVRLVPLGCGEFFSDVGFFQLALLSVRLTDGAHEFGSSLCNAFIAHFEGVQFVL